MSTTSCVFEEKCEGLQRTTAACTSTPFDKLLCSHNKAISDLLRSESFTQGDFDALAEQVTGAAAALMGVERVGIWMLADDAQTLQCVAMQDKDGFAGTATSAISAQDYPAYFAAMRHDRAIAAHDASEDPRTSSLSDAYLTPNGITSMLDAPIISGDRVIGVICHEHIGASRQWSQEEINFSTSLADLLSHSLAVKTLKDTERALRHEKDNLERQIAERTASLNQELTERKWAEESLRAATDAALSASDAKTNFLANMSHELRTPMNAIIGFAEFLVHMDADISTEKRHEYLDHILSSGRYLNDLIGDILDLSRIERGKISFAHEPVDVRTVMDESLILVDTEAKKKNIHLSVEIPEQGTCRVDGDFSRLKQVVVNVLSNAIKYNKLSGAVTVHCRVDESAERVRLSVTDTGIGISADALDKVFEPFHREGNAAAHAGGAGIGLALSKALVEGMNGRLSVESILGEGSSFAISLPLYRAREEKKTANPHQIRAEDYPTLNQPGVRVLYVEDNPINRLVLERSFQRLPNVELQTVETAEEGVRIAVKGDFTAIILDINLSGMDGYGALEKLREHHKTRALPILALTANSMPEEIERGHAAGFDAYLLKPLNVPDVFKTIEGLMTR